MNEDIRLVIIAIVGFLTAFVTSFLAYRRYKNNHDKDNNNKMPRV